ncbi:MAG: SMP-30/gluconolactonase/LRE family protein [Steroidobacteraceae bacterium]
MSLATVGRYRRGRATLAAFLVPLGAVAAAGLMDPAAQAATQAARLPAAGAAAYTPAHLAAPPREILIPGARIFPESLTSTSDGAVIIGSIGQGAIYRALPGSTRASLWIRPGAHGIQSIFGVLADEKSNTLWACSNSLGPPRGPPHPRPALYAFDLATGALKGRYAFPSFGALCNDISIGPDGTAYATDTYDMEVVRLRKGARRLEVWAGHGAFGPKGGLLDGIVVLNGRVIVGTLATSKLFSIPIEPDGRAGPVAPITLDHPLARPDGIRRFGREGLLVAQGGAGGRLSRVTLHGNRAVVVTVKQGFPQGPTAVTVVGTTAYVAQGQLATLFAKGYGPHTKTQPFHAIAVYVGRP